MANIVVVYHSGYGHTKRQAEAVAQGADAALVAIGAEGTLTEADWAALEAADAIIFGSPTYMGMASWQFKRFADASSKPWFSRKWKDKVAAGFTNSATMNGDKLSTLHYMFTLAMQHGMIWVGLGMLPAERAGDPDRLNRLGSYLGVMAQADNLPPDQSPPPGDLETAFVYGQRIAGFARLR